MTNHAVIINTDHLLFLLNHFLSGKDKSFLCVNQVGQTKLPYNL